MHADLCRYQFPSPESPLLAFLDTRGVDEPGYDPAEYISAFNSQAHVIVVTAKATDFAQGNIRHALEPIRKAYLGRPVILCVTCLNEAIPRQPHPQPYPFDPSAPHSVDGHLILAALARHIDEHRRAFAGLFDLCVPIDLTKPADGFADPTYGGETLKRALMDSLPAAYRQTLLSLKEATDALKEVHLRHAAPIIVAYSSMAASAGAVPIPFVDMALLPGIQTRMVHHLAKVYGQPMTAERFREVATSLGLGILARQAVREVTKFIPYVGSVAGAAVAWASTYALGRAFCHYYQAVCEGHIPDAHRLKKFYHEQYAAAEKGFGARGSIPGEPGA